jgi:hypothetical protein
MNDDTLFRLLDEEASRFHPQPDTARLRTMVSGGIHRRGKVVAVFSAAAGLALLGGTVAAVQGRDTDRRLVPADSATTIEDHAAPTTTVHSDPSTTVAPTTTHHDDPTTTAAPTSTVHSDPTTTVAEVLPIAQPPATQPPPVTVPATNPPKPKPTTPPAPTAPPAPPAPPTTVHSEPPVTVPATNPPASVGWSARQAYGSCNANPPYEDLSGTASPGTVVNASSPYGSGSTTADVHGEWRMTVYFPSAPVGETFTISVSSSQGSSSFSFVRTP